MFYGITLILLGLLAAPSLLLSRRPDAKEMLDKITPYQGWFGAIMCFWGLWGTIQAVLNIGILKFFPVYWATWLATSVMSVILGFILGYGLINQHLLANNEAAKAKGEETLRKLAPLQGRLGLIGVILGIWCVIASILFY
jgi:hypothetical protein